MADKHNPLPGVHMGVNHHTTVLIPRNNTWHTSEHSLGRASQNRNHLSNDNEIPEFRYNLLCLRETGIFTQRSRHPLPLVRIFHGDLSCQILSRDNHDHGTTVNQLLPVVYPHPGQRPQQGHQYPHDKKKSFYTILEVEIVYHTPVQDNTEPHRLNLQRRGR